MKRTVGPLFILLFILLIFGGVIYGQQKKEVENPKTGYFRGEIRVMQRGGWVPAGNILNGAPVNGAVARLITGADTLYTVVTDGAFLFDGIPQGKANVTITHVSYETLSEDVEILLKTQKIFDLNDRVFSLEEVAVYGEMPLVTMVGDTIRFNAAAVKLLEDDVALSVLLQVPGVEVSESGITILGKNVSRTYVNKREIFGRDHMTALLHLPASEVISIDTYEEYANRDSLSRKENDSKVRVLNIRTKNPIFAAATGHALASLGRDFERSEHDRYGIGATGNFFSEYLLFAVNAFHNNIGRQSNRMSEILSSLNRRGYMENTYVDASADKSWFETYSDNIRLRAGYTYNQTYSTAENSSWDLYLPSQEYDSRSDKTNAEIDNKQGRHDWQFDLDISKSKYRIELRNLFSRQKEDVISYRQSVNSLNGSDLYHQSGEVGDKKG